MLAPKKTEYCEVREHRKLKQLAEFYCVVESKFYCKMCAKNHKSHINDQNVYEVANEIQESLTLLKHIFHVKRSNVMGRLNKHQAELEEYFHAFYSILDAKREEVLRQEYHLREVMAQQD